MSDTETSSGSTSRRGRAHAASEPAPETSHEAKSSDEQKAEEASAADERMKNHDLNPSQRLERLEAVCARFFGTEHFEIAKPLTFDPEAQKQEARQRFQMEMERIEADAKKNAN